MLSVLTLLSISFLLDLVLQAHCKVTFYDQCPGSYDYTTTYTSLGPPLDLADCTTECIKRPGCSNTAVYSYGTCFLAYNAPETVVLTQFGSFDVAILRPSQLVGATYNKGGQYCYVNFSGAGCAGVPQGDLSFPGVIRTSGVSAPYLECTGGALRAYQCCQFRAGGDTSATAPDSSVATACAGQYRLDINQCNAVGDNTACSAADLTSNLNACCTATYATVPEGPEGPACQFGTQLKVKKRTLTSPRVALRRMQ